MSQFIPIKKKACGCAISWKQTRFRISHFANPFPVRQRQRTYILGRPAPATASQTDPLMPDSKVRVFITAEQIRTRIQELAAQIDKDYAGEEPIHMIAILKGAFIFLADISRAVQTPARIDFMGISSYGRGKTSSGEVKVTKDLDVSIEGSNVLIVEDIVDSGVTLTYLCHLLEQRKPKSIRIAALLDKPDRRLRPVKVDYVGFSIPDEFVIGYGLDYAEDYRNLGDICILDA
jgi:hypoxanthine phosphoribosyltransferase